MICAPFSKHFRSLDFLWLTAPDFELHAALTRLDYSSLSGSHAENGAENTSRPLPAAGIGNGRDILGPHVRLPGGRGRCPQGPLWDRLHGGPLHPSFRRTAAACKETSPQEHCRQERASSSASLRSLKAGSFPQSKRLGGRFGLFQSLAASAVTPEARSNRSRNSVPDSTCPKGIREEDARKSR